jgi:hypothetical protein
MEIIRRRAPIWVGRIRSGELKEKESEIEKGLLLSTASISPDWREGVAAKRRPKG